MKPVKARFEKTAASPSGFIRDGLPQVAFAGRSNVGKSSIINCLLGRNDIARVGASPGKTANINYFSVEDRLYFVDLPGFGYAKVSRAEQARWAALLDNYLNVSGLMTLGVQLVDIRHDPMERDKIMTSWFKQTGVPFIVVANKLDKIKKSQIQSKLDAFREGLELDESVPLIAFSTQTKEGRQELFARIMEACER